MLEENNAPKTSHPLPHCEQTPSLLLGCLPKPSTPHSSCKSESPRNAKRLPYTLSAFHCPLEPPFRYHFLITQLENHHEAPAFLRS